MSTRFEESLEALGLVTEAWARTCKDFGCVAMGVLVEDLPPSAIAESMVETPIGPEFDFSKIDGISFCANKGGVHGMAGVALLLWNLSQSANMSVAEYGAYILRIAEEFERSSPTPKAEGGEK